MSNWDESEHPRDGDGQFTDKPLDWAGKISAQIAGKADRLKLAARIQLEPDQQLVGSDKIDREGGTVRIAVVEGPTGRRIRLGVGSYGFGSSEVGRETGEEIWAGQPSNISELNAQSKKNSEEYDRLDAEWADADPDRKAEIEARLEQLDDLPRSELYRSGATAELTPDGLGQLFAQITPDLQEAERLQAESDALWNEVELAEQRLKPLRGMRRKWTDEEDALWDRLAEELAQAKAAAEVHQYTRSATGMVPGRWGDLHYEVETDDPGIGPKVMLWVHPHDEPDWERGWAEDSARWDIEDFHEVLQKIRKTVT